MKGGRHVWGAAALPVALALLVTAVLAARPAVAKDWSVGDEITGGTVNAPTSGWGYACNSEVTCTVTEATDWDHWTDGMCCPPMGDEKDTLTYTWTAPTGTFKNGVNTGTSVTWIAPSTTSTSVTITCTITDAGTIGGTDTGTRDDEDVELQKTVKVYKIGCVKIEATMDLDIYWPDPQDGEEATSNVIWKANQSDFETYGTISETCTRKAVAAVFRRTDEYYTLAFTLTRYPSCETNQSPTTDLAKGSTAVGSQSGWTPSYSMVPATTVKHVTYDAQLTFKVGSIQVNTQAVSGVDEYDIYAMYQCAQADFTKVHLGYACAWADGGTAVTQTDIPAKIQAGSWNNFKAGTWVDPWSLGTQQGDCRPHSGILQCALNVLGVAADGVTSANDTSYKVGEGRYCEEHDETEWHWFQEVKVGESAAAVTNFEAVCKVTLRDEQTPWDCYFDKAMGPVYQSGNYTSMWYEWNSDPPPNCKVIHHYVYWDNHQ